jgi:NADPH:quinone reductase-like Zn-dependent oxidoreductase
VRIERPGSYERLTLQEDVAPEAGPGEVQIEVEAAGVNFADCVVRMGLYESARKYVGWPITPGFEVAGRVASVGAGVVDLRPGDEVLGVTRFGGYSTLVVIPQRQVFRRPASLSAPQAAAIPAVFMTAYFALHELAHPKPGDDLLVHSAAGGVGGALVQLGKLAGCRVVGVVGAAHKVEEARRCGADEVIVRGRDPLWATARRLAPGGYAVILDANGADSLRQSYRHLGSPGKLVVYGFHTMLRTTEGRPSWARLALDWLRTPRFNPLDMTGANRSVLAFNLSYLFERAELLASGMERLLGWFASGELRPPPVSTYAMERVADAHRALESGQTTGKLVLLTGLRS